MEVTLIYSTPLDVAELAARTCTRTIGDIKTGQYPENICFSLLTTCWEKGHHSIFEHINFTFQIRNISRGLLQQLVRHRFLALSVESTRATLHKRLAELITDQYWESMEGDDGLNRLNQLVILKSALTIHSNDEAKYYVPDWFPTDLILTTNLRELAHIFELRSKPDAWKPFRRLVEEMKKVMAPEYLYVIGLSKAWDQRDDDNE
jgi:thymidylate synthase (FAD)